MPLLRPARLLFILLMMALASGCGTTSSGSIIKTVHDIEGAARFSNILVISVAGDRPSRAQFEQKFVATVSSENNIVTAFFAAVGRNPQLTRSILNNVVRSRAIDAVLLVRLQGQDRADLWANRPTGRNFDLYLYDYAELNTPAPINVDSTVSFVAEIYDTRAEKKIWAIESLIFDAESVESVVTDQASVIAAEIRKDRLIRR